MNYPQSRRRKIKAKAAKQGVPEKGDSRVLSSWGTMAKQELRRNATPAELCFMNKLLDAGFIYHTFQKGFKLDGRMIIADFHIRKPHKVVIEIDGGYHFTPEQLFIDIEKDKIFLSQNECSSVLRMNNEQAFSISLSELTETINSLKKGIVTCLYPRP